MGRLTEARKRARRGAATPADAAPPAPDADAPQGAVTPAPAASEADLAPSAEHACAEPPPVAPSAGGDGAEARAALEPEADAPATAESAPAAEPETVESDAGTALIFRDDDVRLPARYVLPSSGLADDILAAADSDDAPAGEAGSIERSPTAEAAAASTRAHQFTFFAAPERDAREQVEATEHLVTFLVGGEEYGVDVRLVQEIIRVPAVTAVPRAPAFVRGVVNLRGRIIPVIDLKTKLGLGRVDAGQRRARVVVVRLKGRLVGLLVDGASQVLKVPVSVIEAAPEEVVEVESHFLRGVAKLDGRLIILVDLLEVLAPELRADGVAP
jgi:purine-binding chemotaxis protein CheW